MKGHAGRILNVNLTSKQVKTIDTKQYEEWIGGNGIATAIWFDLVNDKKISGFDPRNPLVLMTGLFAGTLVPAANRLELVGNQIQSYPIEWFTRSNIGGRVPAMMKYAGYDGIILTGAADKPVWINVIDGEAEIRDASGLWGLDTYETQKVIIREVSGGKGFGNWLDINQGKLTTQRPAVLAIGPAGENLSRAACIIHDAGCAFGQGGFGGIWGAKKLKAISFLGSKGIEIADSKALMDSRLWATKNYGPNFDNPKIEPWMEAITSHFGGYPARRWTPFDYNRRPYGCIGCHLNCKPRTASGLANEAICAAATFYHNWDLGRHGTVTEISGAASNLLEKLGINAFEVSYGLEYLNELYEMGVLGCGKEIHTDLPFDEIGEMQFIEEYLHRIAYRVEIGDDLAEGLTRAAKKWGRLEQDLKSGLHPEMFLGYVKHYDARTETYWGYASILAGRDINCHDFNVPAFRIATQTIGKPLISAEETAQIISEKCIPFNDPKMIDFSDENIYSIPMAKTTAWLMYYSLFWKQSCGLCDNAFADFVNPNGPNNRGITPDGEMKFFNAVTGLDLSFPDSMEIGKKIWNLNRAILVLQGRHRNMEIFPEYIYTKKTANSPYIMPVVENGKWLYKNVATRTLDKEKVEAWKTLYYKLEGWDPKTGWPTNKTLKDYGLKKVADELEKQGKHC